LINNTQWKLIDNQRKSKSPKKDAIKTAIKIAQFEWIITTDADCIVPKKWLKCYNDFIMLFIDKSIKTNMIVAPVAYKTNGSFLQNFQNIDFLSLIGSTIGGFGINKPFLCNGANLCYKKETFFAVNGFDGNDNIASGDDIFLLDKITNKYPNTVHYLKSKDALVLTKPETTFKGLLSQRVRWASKTAATKNWFGKLVGGLVLLMNLFLVFGFGFWVLGCFTEVHSSLQRFTEVLVFMFLIKFNLDFLLIQKTYKFVGINNGLKSYILSSVLYPFFVVLVVLLSFFKKYEWKGRSFNK
jgi:cellulose synthase/poly-beta-1,6-N-acetylglucosamine synthase-like glycosyltransferase